MFIDVQRGETVNRNQTSKQELRNAFQEVKGAHTDLVAKHEAYTMFLTDKEHTEAEIWMDDCPRELSNSRY